jgi:hypothetical protein
MKELFTSLVKAQLELKNPDKNTKGYNYKYADLASVLDLVKPILAKNGLAIVQFPVTRPDSEWIGVKTILVHDSGESMEETLYLPTADLKQGNDTQEAGATITYARRYAICAILNISADEDTDGTVKNAKTKKEGEIAEPRMNAYEKAKAEDKGKKDVEKAKNYAGYGSLPAFKPASDKQKHKIKIEMQILVDEGHKEYAEKLLTAKGVKNGEELAEKVSISEASNLIDAIVHYRLENEKKGTTPF